MQIRDVALTLSAILLAGCATGGGWVKPGAGADAATAAGEVRECRTLAESAVKTDIDIDQDIAATRQSDWQRAQLGRIAAENMREPTRERAAAITANCMRAKGFAPAR